jgi:hypothetical protein
MPNGAIVKVPTLTIATHLAGSRVLDDARAILQGR